jgi:hypothetical protein
MTPVTRAVAAVASIVLAAGLAPAAPASAEGAADQVSGLVGSLSGQQADGSRASSQDRSDFGRTAAPNGRLHRGCRNYPYRYRVSPPTDDWILETFLRDPTGESIASGNFTSDSEPRALTSRFRFCRYNTRPGRFTIRALLHWYGSTGDEHTIWLEPSHFRLRRPR